MTSRDENELWRTMAGGAGATGLMSALVLLSKKLGLLQLDFGRLLGTMAAPDGSKTRAAGWMVNLVNGSLLALVYRLVFRRLGMWPNALTGALVGVVHAVLALGFVALAPAIHPRRRQAGLRRMRPTANGPLTIPGMVMGHMLYGAVVGWWIERAAARRAYVSPAFLRWLQLQENEERVPVTMVPAPPRLRAVPDQRDEVSDGRSATQTWEPWRRAA